MTIQSAGIESSLIVRFGGTFIYFKNVLNSLRQNIFKEFCQNDFSVEFS